MAVKMKVMVWGSQAACVITLIVGFVIFAVSLHHLNTEHRQISVPAILRWRSELIRLVCLCGYIIVFSAVWAWLATKYQTKDKFIAAFVLFTLLAGFSLGLYTTINSYVLSQNNQMDVDTLFNSTKNAIKNGIQSSGTGTWLPEWLNVIQAESKLCCGVKTYNDYNEFWNPIKNQVPRSCCRNGGDSSNCHTDLQTIPFPDTVADNIKVDSGCYDEIIAKISQILCEVFTLSVATTASIGFTTLVFFLEYLCAYCFKSSSNPDDSSPTAVFRTEEQTWQTLDLFPVRKDLTNMAGQTTDDLGAMSGETFDVDNKMTNTDLTGQAQPSDPTKNVQVSSQETMTVQNTSFIPEVNSLPEIGNDASLDGGIYLEQTLQQQMPEDLGYFEPNPRSYVRRHHRRRRE